MWRQGYDCASTNLHLYVGYVCEQCKHCLDIHARCAAVGSNTLTIWAGCSGFVSRLGDTSCKASPCVAIKVFLQMFFLYLHLVVLGELVTQKYSSRENRGTNVAKALTVEWLEDPVTKASRLPGSSFTVKEEAKSSADISLSANQTLSASKRALVFGTLRTERSDQHRHFHPKDPRMRYT